MDLVWGISGAALLLSAGMLVGADGHSANWISHGRAYSEQRYAPLDQVNKGMVGDLGLAWFADMDTARAGGDPAGDRQHAGSDHRVERGIGGWPGPARLRKGM